MLVALCIIIAIVALYYCSPCWFQPVKDVIDSGCSALREGYRVREFGQMGISNEPYRTREFGQMGISYEPYRTREFQQRGITSTTIDGQYQAAALAGRM